MQKAVVVLVLFSLLLSGCGTFEVYIDTTPAAESSIPVTAATVEPQLSLESTSQEIQLAMLESAAKWKSIWMDGAVTGYAMPQTDSQTSTTREQVWIDLTTNRFRVLTGPMEGAAEQFLASDGMTILKMDLKTGESQSSPMPEFAQIGPFVPTLQPGYAYPQPLWGQMGTPLSQLAFTSDFAQNEGTFKPVAIESIAGRETLVVEWTYVENDKPSWRIWLDTKTAVILNMQSFDKAGGDTIRTKVVVNQISFDDVFADSLFGIPSALPQFGDIHGQSQSVETGADAPSGRDAQGELYFFQSPRQTGQTAQLVRLPGLCALGEAECPQLETVMAPFAWTFSLPQLSWSPDGNLAVLAYPDNEAGTPFKLWLFDPAANTWTSLWEYAYIDMPMWSPDGEWISFRQQDGLGGEDVMVIRPDGSEPKNLTIGGNLPEQGKPYVMDGWVTGNVIVRSGKPGQEGTVYLIRVADAKVRPMFDTLLTKSIFFPSYDGAWIAYDDYDYSSLKHSLQVAEPDGANGVELASFTGGSIYPVVWSPDNKKLAFTYYTEITQGSQTADVYVINRNGKGLKQVYKGSTVGAVLFSPDGRYLFIHEASSATGARLFVVNVDTLEQRILQAPGLTLDSDWSMPSWRK